VMVVGLCHASVLGLKSAKCVPAGLS
jgi:hypothetical protein